MNRTTIRMLLATASVATAIVLAGPADAYLVEGGGATAASPQATATDTGTVSYPSHVIGGGERDWDGQALPPPAEVQAVPSRHQETATASGDDFEWASFGAGAGAAALLAAGLAGAVLSTRKRRTVGLS